MSIKLPGVVLITGAASGIGQACAKEFAEAGCRHLILIDRDAGGLENTVKLLNVDPNRVTTHTLDVLDDTAVEKLVTDCSASEYANVERCLFPASSAMEAWWPDPT